MDNKQIFLIPNKNPPQNQNKPENINNKFSDQNKNLNESMITTSTSSISVNNKKNIQHTNYKTPKKKKFSNTRSKTEKFKASKLKKSR
jgi:hypothetical protein